MSRRVSALGGGGGGGGGEEALDEVPGFCVLNIICRLDFKQHFKGKRDKRFIRLCNAG